MKIDTEAYNQPDGFSKIVLDGNQPLGSQVYYYLRELLRTDKLKPGSVIETGTLAKHLGVSKTPLRDALIKLQTEGFLKILPQRGVVISSLDASEVKQIIQILGGLESKAIMIAFPYISEIHLTKMNNINEKLFAFIEGGQSDYRKYNKLNISFHDIFLDVCGNELMVNQIRTYKERLYHFPDRDYGDTWRKNNADEHLLLMDIIKNGDPAQAANFMRDVHWDLEILM